MSIDKTMMRVYSRRAVLFGFASVPVWVTVAGDNYEQNILQYRKEAEEHFRSASGPLTLIARFSPQEGTSTLGGDPASSLVVPEKSAPARVGVVAVKGGKATLQFDPSVTAVMNGKSVSFIETDNQSDKGAGVTIGDLRVRLYFIRGDQLQISVIDPNWILRREVQARAYFDVDRKYQVTANWIPYAAAKTVHFPDNDGSSRERTIPGYVTFTLDGKDLRLTPMLRPENPKPFFVFGDTTNNHETYGAGRFLEVDPPQNGKIILDFNKSYNPLCAYNHEFLCPVAPKENRLATPIRAGERKYPGNHSA
jgi:uncharacterized protein (DUF1684 family)